MLDFVKPKRRVTRTFFHCTASSDPAHDDISVIRAWHKARKWRREGYHGLIQFSGNFQEGRPVNEAPAAQANHNSGTLAYCLSGLKVSDFTNAQLETALELVKLIDAAYNGRMTFHGHCEVAAKSCPVFGYRGALNLDKAGNYLGERYTKKPDVPEPDSFTEPKDWPQITLGDTGPAVVRLQKALNIAGAFMGVDLVPDGIFGNKTAEAVIELKREYGFYPSPVVAEWVWDRLLSATDPRKG